MISLELSAERNINDKYRPYGHDYIPGYKTLFDNIRSNVRTVLEIGIGSTSHQAGMRRSWPTYRSGNSLRMWRDYFDNAAIHGIDIDPAAMFSDEPRITTHLCNQSSTAELHALMTKISTPPDIIIDDGSHALNDQVISFMTLEKYLPKGGIYVIEDILAPNIERMRTLTAFSDDFQRYIRENYDIQWFDTRAHSVYDNDILMAFIRR
jgi:hypothetical protein